ncbi:MAG: hypothetical protein AB8G17_11370 [Gammaproteobacteria bacterium]
MWREATEAFTLRRMSTMTRFTHFFLAAALSLLVACVFLINQYKQGIPLSFVMSLVVAALVGVLVPSLTTAAYAYFRRGQPGRFLVFELTCLCLAIGLGVMTF